MTPPRPFRAAGAVGIEKKSRLNRTRNHQFRAIAEIYNAPCFYSVTTDRIRTSNIGAASRAGGRLCQAWRRRTRRIDDALIAPFVLA